MKVAWGHAHRSQGKFPPPPLPLLTALTNTNEKVLMFVSVIVIKTLSWVEIYLFSDIELLYDYKIYHAQLNIKSMLLLLNKVRFNNNY